MNRISNVVALVVLGISTAIGASPFAKAAASASKIAFKTVNALHAPFPGINPNDADRYEIQSVKFVDPKVDFSEIQSENPLASSSLSIATKGHFIDRETVISAEVAQKRGYTLSELKRLLESGKIELMVYSLGNSYRSDTQARDIRVTKIQE